MHQGKGGEKTEWYVQTHAKRGGRPSAERTRAYLRYTSTFSGGRGGLKKFPCTMSHWSRRRIFHSSSVSTPSAIVLRLRLLAMAMIALTMVEEWPSSASSLTKEMSIFRLSKGNFWR